MRTPLSFAPHKQQGVVLIVGLIFLLVLTMIGISVTMVNTQAERRAGNDRDRNRAFQAAEAAMRDADRNVFEIDDYRNYTSACIKGLCTPEPDATGNPVWERFQDNTIGFVEANSAEYGDSFDNLTQPLPATTTNNPNMVIDSNLAHKPRYLMEETQLLPNAGAGVQAAGGIISADNTKGYYQHYRITAVAFGVNPNTRVITQSVSRWKY